jgi:hypothetical protein
MAAQLSHLQSQWVNIPQWFFGNLNKHLKNPMAAEKNALGQVI